MRHFVPAKSARLPVDGIGGLVSILLNVDDISEKFAHSFLIVFKMSIRNAGLRVLGQRLARLRKQKHSKHSQPKSGTYRVTSPTSLVTSL